MRIVIALPWGQRLGGAESMLQTVLDGAAASGHELELVFLEDGDWPRELRAAGLRVEVIPAGQLRQIHRWAATVVRLARLFRRRGPDLILNWAPKTQLYGSPAALLAGMPGRVVWWQHGIPDGHWMDRLATRLPARAVGCTSSAAAAAQKRMKPARPTFVVPAAARAPGPSAAAPSLELPAGVPVVGMVGRLQPWKGQDRLLRAQALLRERGRELHLLVVGGDAYGLSSEYAAELPRLADSLGLAGAVTMTGQVPDAGPYIELMDVLVNASEPEPFGIVLLEGMARGVAVVAVGSGGPTEIIDGGRTGMLARTGEPEALAEALEPLLDSAELRGSLAAAGRESYLRDFTEEAMRERFFRSLEEVAGVRAPVAEPVA
jgi:glycosyltransferase involved in cell wall biosynthesis